ncbi:hypothetical protein M8R20_28415 [Pseudomonas sp. R2.Fl]|nr:hypothetical protein [Pseudomonas sp. R2.Fl]
MDALTEAEDAVPAGPRQGVEQEVPLSGSDDKVVSLAHVLYGYHQGPSPRAGARVQMRRSRRTAVVLGVLADGSLLVVDDGNGRLYSASTDRLQPVRTAARLSLHDWLMLAQRLAKMAEPYALSVLSAHFRGINGAVYACPPAMAWCVQGLLQSRWFGPHTAEAETWLRRYVAMLPTGHWPAPATDDDIARWSERGGDEQTDAIEACVEQALNLGRASLDQAARDDELKAQYREDRTGALAVDVETGLQVVILGPSKTTRGEGVVDALFLDNLEPATRHVSGLEIGAETIDPAWLWEAVTGAARRPKPGLAVALWLAASDVGPSGMPEPSDARAYVRVVAAAMGVRALGRPRASAAHKWLKLARETWRLLPQVTKARLAALIPELVASSRQKVVADADLLRPEFRTAVERMLEQHPVPIVSRATRAVWAPRAVVELDDELMPASADQADAAPARRERRPRPTQSTPRVRFTRPQRQLRFDLSDRALLASEWALPPMETAFGEAVTTALRWLEGRMGLTLPKTWREGAHEIERLGVTLQLESGPGIFAFRLDHPDTEHPTRWWRTEVTVLAGTGGCGGMVGVRLVARDLVALTPPLRTVPAIVREWARSPGLVIAGAATHTRTTVRDLAGLARLSTLLADPERDAPIWVTREPFSVTASLQGLARVVLLDPAMESAYAAQYAAVAPGGLHLFAAAGTAPVLLFPRAKAGQEDLRRQTLEARQRTGTPSFREVRDAVAEARLHALTRARAPIVPSASEPAPPLAPSTEDIRTLISREVRDYEELLRVAEEERDHVAADRDGVVQDLLCAEEEIQDLRRRLHAAQSQLRVTGAAVPATPVREPPPAALEQIGAWAPSLAPRLVFADKAIRFAARTPHNEPGLIYATLQQLAEAYWPSRWADSEDQKREGREAWEEFLRSHRLRWSGVGSAIQDSRYVQEYRATVQGRTYTMDMHVAGSSTHDPLRCLRIYCYADEASRQIVVGHLPTHLTSGLT